MRAPYPVLILAAFTLATVAGCAQRTDQSSTIVPADTSLAPGEVPEPGTVPAPAANTDAEPAAGDSGRPVPSDSMRNVAVSGTLGQLRDRLRSEARGLDRAAKAGETAGAAASATRVRDVAVAIGGKASEFPKAGAADIEQTLADVVDGVDQLNTDAQAGKRAEVRAANTKVQPLLTRLLDLTAAP